MDEDQRSEFMDELYNAKGNAEATAKDQLRAHLASQGVEWDGDI
jgi:hypothetical protein